MPVFAAIFLLKFLAIDIGASEWEKELARNHVMLAHKLFKRCKVVGEQDRAAQMIEFLSRMTRPGDGSFKLHVNDRFGASLLFDALREVDMMRTREHQNAKVEVPAPLVNQDEHDTQIPAVIVSSPAPLPLTVQTQHFMEIGNLPEQMAQEQLNQEWVFLCGMWDNTTLQDPMFFGETWDLNLNIDQLMQ